MWCLHISILYFISGFVRPNWRYMAWAKMAYIIFGHIPFYIPRYYSNAVSWLQALVALSPPACWITFIVEQSSMAVLYTHTYFLVSLPILYIGDTLDCECSVGACWILHLSYALPSFEVSGYPFTLGHKVYPHILPLPVFAYLLLALGFFTSMQWMH